MAWGPEQGKEGKSQREDGEEEVTSGAFPCLAALKIAEEMTGGVDGGSGGEGPYKDRAADSREEEQGMEIQMEALRVRKN